MGDEAMSKRGILTMHNAFSDDLSATSSPWSSSSSSAGITSSAQHFHTPQLTLLVSSAPQGSARAPSQAAPQGSNVDASVKLTAAQQTKMDSVLFCQNADGSWSLSEELARALGVNLSQLRATMPKEVPHVAFFTASLPWF